ncbi:Leukocyte elastase inhibitor B [Zootermopsis nevadensis]|uniref:Leukocyte elastase inhibitor B n=2 Tax=Zootermopsis nevadensis TaxID=136037 RepID=A0A067QX46_ZOONE|nr:Leukocyte elastase inhibitor B [Zootermopsis nevadensis]
MDAMVDVTNDFGVAVLQDYAYMRCNVAFSPYGVTSVLVVLYEGSRGEAARQIHNALRLPWNKDVTRIGFRDIHRHLRSYFSHEGYLSGLTLNKNHTSLLLEYRRVLRFYGYDVGLASGDSFPPTTTTLAATETMTTTTKPSNSVTTLSAGELETTTEEGFITSDKTTPEAGSTLVTVNIPIESTTSNKLPYDKTIPSNDSPGDEQTFTPLSDPTNPASPMEGATTPAQTATAPALGEPEEPPLTVSHEETEQQTNSAAPPKQTTESMALTEQPTERVTHSEQATISAVPTEQPTGTMGVTNQPTETVAQTEQPTGTMGVTNQPTETVAQTEQPTGTLGVTNQPTGTMGVTDQPTGTMGVTDQPTETVAQTEQPTGTKGVTDQPTETMGVTDQPTETVAQTEQLERGVTLTEEEREPKPETTSDINNHTAFDDTAGKETEQVTFRETYRGDSTVPYDEAQVQSVSRMRRSTPFPVVYNLLRPSSENYTLESINRSRRSIEDAVVAFPDIDLQLQDGMSDSLSSRGYELHAQLPRRPFLVNGVSEELVPVMSYTATFLYAYIQRLHAQALEFPLDDERYKLLLLLPVARRGLRQLTYDLTSCPLREIYQALRPTNVQAVIPSFMVEGSIILTPTLQQLGIWDVFDPHRANLSGMSDDPELYVRNIEQSVAVVIRNYVKILDIQTRKMAARATTEQFVITHPFLYFVLDTDTRVALMAGKIVNPLNSKIY